MNQKEKHKLKKLIRELDSIRGRHTELISVYVPSGYDMNKVINHLLQEQGTAVNIKDARTRKNVIDSLERAVRHLRLYKQTPQNGLALFSGNASTNESKVDLKVWAYEPEEEKINQRIYRCDQTFVTDILKEFLEYKEVYGLIVMDRREATIGLLRGPRIEVLSSLTSGVPGKFKAGGQCLAKDTLVMLDDGRVIKIKDVHNPNMIVSENFNREKSESTPVISKWHNNKELFSITTCYPKIEIKASGDHTLFVRTNNGIEEKPVSEICRGDYLLIPERIDLDLKNQDINFKPRTKKKTKKVMLPNKIDPSFSRILGYYLGDGNYEIDRLTFSEERKELAQYYARLISKYFEIEAKVKYRADKNYYQLRVYSRILSQLFRFFFEEQKKTLYSKVPDLIMRSSNESLAAFIGGFFDAEGYVKDRVGFGIHNEFLAKQIQFLLLRLGIISSLSTYDNKKNPYSNKVRYSVAIYDNESLISFYNLVGFSSKEKQKKLKKLIIKRSNRNKVRQLAVNGMEVARILKNSGLILTPFGCPSFFTNKRQMSKMVFKNRILNKIVDPDLRRRLEMFYNSNLFVVKIKNKANLGWQNVVDIETKNHNFIANGLLVHNSSQRFARLIEGMAKEFYKRVANVCNKEFLGMKELKGILVGGPGPTKHDFIEELNQQIKDKIIGVEDLTYTDESGLHHLVDKSKEVLANEAVTEEKEIMTRFFTMLAKENSKTAYGENEVRKALEYGAVDVLLISEDIQDEKVEEFEELCSKTRTELRIISTETREGQQLRDIGGIAAILRFPVVAT